MVQVISLEMRSAAILGPGNRRPRPASAYWGEQMSEDLARSHRSPETRRPFRDSSENPRQPEPPEFDALFMGEWARVLRHLRRSVRDEGLAEELAQETFLRAARGMEAFRGECSPRTWLRRIAANVLRDYWRGRANHATTVLRPWPPDAHNWPADSDESPALAVERQQVRACLGELVSQLPPGERKALTLAVSDGMRPGEVARSLGLAPEAARARLHRARRKLASLVSQRCVLVNDEGGALSCEARASGLAGAAPVSGPVPSL